MAVRQGQAGDVNILLAPLWNENVSKEHSNFLKEGLLPVRLFVSSDRPVFALETHTVLDGHGVNLLKISGIESSETPGKVLRPTINVHADWDLVLRSDVFVSKPLVVDVGLCLIDLEKEVSKKRVPFRVVGTLFTYDFTQNKFLPLRFRSAQFLAIFADDGSVEDVTTEMDEVAAFLEKQASRKPVVLFKEDDE